jgi:hypothetical protein
MKEAETAGAMGLNLTTIDLTFVQIPQICFRDGKYATDFALATELFKCPQT